MNEVYSEQLPFSEEMNYDTRMTRSFYCFYLAFCGLGLSLMTSCSDDKPVTPPAQALLKSRLKIHEASDPQTSSDTNPWRLLKRNRSAQEECQEDEDDTEDPVQRFLNPQSDEYAPGHSSHGRAFDQGAKWILERPTQVGEVNFAAESCDPSTQSLFSLAVGLLHGFALFEAESVFREIAMKDPDCAMAYWGLAMSQLVFQAGSTARACKFTRIAESLGPTASPREQLYINGLSERFSLNEPNQIQRQSNLADSFRKVFEAHAEDLDAKAFYVLFSWESADYESTDYLAKILDWGMLLDQIFAINPQHPAHHYKIHVFDMADREMATRGLVSARSSGPVAFDIAHQWHMASHIYRHFDYTLDAYWATQASVRRDHWFLTRYSPLHRQWRQIIPYEIHNYRHHADWFILASLSVGQIQSAFQHAWNLQQIPQPLPLPGASRVTWIYQYAMERSFDLLWEYFPYLDHQVLSAPELVDSSEPFTLAMRTVLWARSSLLKPEHIPQARALLLQLESLENADSPGNHLGLGSVDQQEYLKLSRALIELAELKNAGTQKKLEAAFDYLVKHPHEALNEMILAEIALELGLIRQSISLAKSYQKEFPKGQYSPFSLRLLVNARLSRVLREAGNIEDSQAVDLSNSELADRTSPLFSHLPLTSLPTPPSSFPEDWDRLGPLHWSPITAPEIAFATEERDEPKRLSTFYKEKPVLLVLSLGADCLVCSDQMIELTRMTQAFRDAGIRVLIVTAEQPSQLRDWLATYRDAQAEAFPFEVFADPRQVVFKTFGAFDDFENKALHGIFLIDTQGRMRIQDISYQAQLDIAFLLKEAQRLLRTGPTL